MTNLLDLVPAFERHMRTYKAQDDTPSKLAGYLADSIEALSFFWPTKGYAITYTPPYTYECSPDIAVIDKRPIILMASIIYKMGNINIAAVTDGDFSYNPFPRGKDTSSLALDVSELEKYIPKILNLAQATSAPLRGFCNVYNLESYDWMQVFSLFT